MPGRLAAPTVSCHSCYQIAVVETICHVLVFMATSYSLKSTLVNPLCQTKKSMSEHISKGQVSAFGLGLKPSPVEAAVRAPQILHANH